MNDNQKEIIELKKIINSSVSLVLFEGCNIDQFNNAIEERAILADVDFNSLIFNINEFIKLSNSYQIDKSAILKNKLIEQSSLCFIGDEFLNRVLTEQIIKQINQFTPIINNPIEINNANTSKFKNFIYSTIGLFLLSILLSFFTYKYFSKSKKLESIIEEKSVTINTQFTEITKLSDEVKNTKDALNEVKSTLKSNNKYFLISSVSFSSNESSFKSSFNQDELHWVKPKIIIYSFLDETQTVSISYNRKDPDGSLATFNDNGTTVYTITETFNIKPGNNECVFTRGWGRELWEIGTYEFNFNLANSFQSFKQNLYVYSSTK